MPSGADPVGRAAPMPAYRVDVQRSAERDLDRLAPALFERITARLAELAADPRPPAAERLVGIDAYRLRVGDYRVIYEISDRERVVVVTRVRHRREVYRTRDHASVGSGSTAPSGRSP